MKEIFQEYGGILITVVAILAVIVVITAVIGKDENRTGVYADYQQFCCAGECKHRGTVNDRTWKRIFWTTVEICCR